MDAVLRCEEAGADSIEGCGNLSLRTRAASLARQAVIRYMKERGRLVAQCDENWSDDCMHLVAWHTQAGINAALDRPSKP